MVAFRSKFRQRLPQFIFAEQGASAVEFALLAPVLVLAFLGTVDVGRALTEQMAIGSLLRTGAQSAMAGGDTAAIEQVLVASSDDGSVVVEVSPRICACPESAQTPVACSTTCAGPAPTGIYYSLAASKTFSGILLRQVPLSRSLTVQVR